MKTIGILGGLGPQATMEFEQRVHRAAQRLLPQDGNTGYPPMVVVYVRRPPVVMDADGRPMMPIQPAPQLLQAARWLGQVADFLVITSNGFVLTEHIHPKQEERFKVLSGSLRMRVNGREQIVQAHEEVAVPAGAAHIWWNDSPEQAHVIVEFRPALNTETMFETLFGLARDGKTDAQSRPNPLQFAVIAQAFKDEALPAEPKDRLLLGVLGPLLALVGRLLGYKAVYPEYTKTPQRASSLTTQAE
jgi:quercetin dioxygenase-like cupin family protein